MKKTTYPNKFASVLAVFIAALMLCVSYTAKAALIAYEGMEYLANTSITNQNGGYGWLDAWQFRSKPACCHASTAPPSSRRR